VKALLALCAALLASCAAAPVVPESKLLRSQEQIGYLVEVSDSPVHRHAGGNLLIRDYDREYPFDWQLTQRATALLEKRLRESTQFRPINLKEHGLTLDDVAGLIGRNKAWALNPQKQPVIERLQKELNIRTVVVLSSSGDQRMLNHCIPFYCRYSRGVGMGLYTTAGLPAFRAVADVIADVYVLDVPVNLAYSDPMKTAQKAMAPWVNDYRRPRNIRAITEEEWQPIRTAVEQSTDSLVEEVVKELLRNR
jgi:hypothetical protein